MKTIKRRAAAIAAIGIIALLAWGFWPRSTASFSDAPSSAAVMLIRPVNGVNQQFLIRGTRKSDPVLLYLNGGPGTPEGILNRLFASNLEQSYVVVQWDQRGSGRSYPLFGPYPEQSIEHHLQDLHSVVGWLKQRYGRRKIILVGHSWGSILGILYSKRHPENVALYVGIGQVVSMKDGEDSSFAFTLNEAKRREDHQALEELRAMGTPPFDFETTVRQRAYVDAYGGLFHKPVSPLEITVRAISAPEYTAEDLYRFFDGSDKTLRKLWPEILRVDLRAQAPRLEVPVAFVLGRYDQTTPAPLAEAYLNALNAPRKEAVWVEDAAHNPHWENPDLFKELLDGFVSKMVSPEDVK
ncbi:alpha/beta fold hydrolase [uncultured Erythrobacter sp.]|uniref:alpha/beta fold hydrolase n=1 Tax=uncultured Erythrobacter sp. TaxID=263913 RepID=UPI00265AB65B|nr:alpha/beta hydrolase [uncultured Erythrobacter sp.]